MVIAFDSSTWVLQPKVQTSISFASFSPIDKATIIVSLNDEDIDHVHTSVPHSWWPASSQPFCRTLLPGDTLKVQVIGIGHLRLDLS